MKYTVIIEPSESGFGAFVPDLPGCVAVGESRKKVLLLISEAISLHIKALSDNGDSIPRAQCVVTEVEVDAA